MCLAGIMFGSIPNPGHAQQDCGLIGSDWTNTYRRQQNYMIGTPLNPTTSAIKTIHVTVHVWRLEEEEFGPPIYTMPNNPGTVAEAIAFVENLTFPYFGAIEAPSHPVAGYNYPADANIRFEVVDVRFIYNTALYNLSFQWNMGPMLTAAAIAEDPDSEGTLHVHLTRWWGSTAFPGPTPYATEPSLGTFNGDVSISIPTAYVWSGDLFQYGGQQAHELGHALGLRHLYYAVPAQPFEECNMANNAEFLFDVFGNSTIPYPSWLQPPTGGCEFGMPWGCDPNNPPSGGCHNNLMRWGFPPSENSNITPMQIGRIHRNLMVANIAKYAWGYDPVPYTLAQSETWDFPIKFYQDIVVPAGVTLTVRCELHMVPQAQIRVLPGGKLIIDGGKVRAALFAPERWRGIQVIGNTNLSQTDANQGVVELRNGAEIADAIIGIRMGGSVSTQGGGIVRSLGSTSMENRFTNCATAVSFSQYLAVNPLAPWSYLSNASNFRSTRFEVDPAFMEYTGGAPFTQHVRMNRVVGVNFRSCTFINTRDATTSAELGHGIRTQDAHFAALACRFEGMDHGIHATGIQPFGWFQAQANVFKNNICGVYASQPTGCRIVGNRFVMGLRDVVLTGFPDIQFQNFHRGIFMHETAKFTIQGNVLERDDNPEADESLEGIVIGYNRDYNDVVRSNRTINLDRGFAGEGVSCSTVPGYASVIGLQFKCNECQNTPVNIWSRPDGSVPPFSQQQHSIRAHQGDLSSVTDNKLDNWPSGGAATDDFRVTTSFAPIKYLHRATAPYAPTDWSLPTLAYPWLINPPPAYACPTISEPPFGLSPENPQLSAAELLEGKTAYDNLRYQYEQIIDGGSTPAVVEEIANAWSQDFLDLHAYLLTKSPYLSVKALRQTMEKEGLPDAIRTAICIANPEATQSEGFIHWLMTECAQPLPEYLIGTIVASWNTRTYRSTLELMMARQHERHSQGALALMDHLLADSAVFALDSLLRIWEEVRTPAARYAEALALVEQEAYEAASDLIASLSAEHRLNEPETDEQQRMLAWIGFVQVLRQSGRTEAELSPAEIAQLEQLIGDAQDRPAVWIGQLLCFHYDLCRTIHTGAGEDPKSLPYIAESSPGVTSTVQFSAVPNPASTWISLSFKSDEEVRAIVIRDLTGRIVHRAMVGGTEGQMIWDCRSLKGGLYMAELLSESAISLAVERVQIVR